MTNWIAILHDYNEGKSLHSATNTFVISICWHRNINAKQEETSGKYHKMKCDLGVMLKKMKKTVDKENHTTYRIILSL